MLLPCIYFSVYFALKFILGIIKIFLGGETVKLKQWIHAAFLTSSMIALTACHSTHKNPETDNAVNEANAAYREDNAVAKTAGAGEETRFGDQTTSKMQSQQAATKRVYYFAFDSNIVHEQDRPSISANAEYLLSHPSLKVILEGHTDPRGSREYNIGLGERRAKAVAEILTAKGVNPAQLRIVSYGAEKLASPGRSEADYQLDRRVVLVYLKK